MLERELNLPFENGFQDIKSGSIVKEMNEMKFGETLVFYVFRVVVGRAYVMTPSEIQHEENMGHDLKEKLTGSKYHSIYISEE